MTLSRWPLAVPVLSDGLVTLRAHRPDDLAPLVEMVADPDTQAWTSVPSDYHHAAAEQFLAEVVTPGWESGTNRIWVIEVNAQFAGQVDLRGHGPVKDIGFALHPAARGRGVMTAAVRLAVDHAFTELQTEVVHWRARVGNLASLRVAHECGFTFHGRAPRALFEQGTLHDAWTGSIAFGEPPVPRQAWSEATVEGSRVRLRPVTVEDLGRWTELLTDEAAHQFLSHASAPFSAGDASARFTESQWGAARRHTCTWALTDLATDDLRGLVIADGLDDPHGGGTELEWALHPDSRGRGFMIEAVRLAVDHVLAEFDQRRVRAFVAASNAASQRVAEAVGFALYGRQSASEPLGDGTFDDLLEYEILR